MKTKFLQFAMVAFAALSIISCSNNDDKVEVLQPNTIMINGNTENITWGEGATLNDVVIYTRFVTRNEDPKVGDIASQYAFEIPFTKIGEKVILQKNINGDPFYSISFQEWTSSAWVTTVFDESGDDNESLKGTNNWVKFIKDSKLENTYTVEFEINFDGKIIKGNYTTNFEDYR